MRSFAMLAIALLLALGQAQAEPAPDAQAILEAMDRNMVAGSQIVTSSMVIHGTRSSRTVKSQSWAEGRERAFTEYLYPPRERGTKMLKLDDQLWIYYPDSDRVIRIAGHMLRNSVMGSDLSYEDMMENAERADSYSARVAGSERLGERAAWVLELEGRREDLAYPRQKVWVDQERMVLLQAELYARSGRLLKRVETLEVMQVQERWYPQRMLYKDVLKDGGGTEFIIHEIVFDEEIPESRFSRAALRR